MLGRGRFLRDNVFLVAAVALPLVVVGLFLIATAIPRWRVPPPAYDLLLLSTYEPFNQTRPRVAADFKVRDGRVEASVRALPATAYPQVPTILLVDHQTMSVREIPVDIPTNLTEADPPAIVPVTALTGRRVLGQGKAPDGYELNTPSYRSTGLVGDLFGMHSRGDRVSIVNRGRVIQVSMPSDRYGYGVSVLGWLLNEGSQ